MKNNHSFSNPTEEEEFVIYSFCPIFEGMDAVFVQNYYFNWGTTLVEHTWAQSVFVTGKTSWPNFKTKLDGLITYRVLKYHINKYHGNFILFLCC